MGVGSLLYMWFYCAKRENPLFISYNEKKTRTPITLPNHLIISLPMVPRHIANNGNKTKSVSMVMLCQNINPLCIFFVQTKQIIQSITYMMYANKTFQNMEDTKPNKQSFEYYR